VTGAGRRRLVVLAAGLLAVSVTPGSEGAGPVLPSPDSEVIHVIRPGDTLSQIARRYGVALDGLITANRPLTLTSRLRVGQRLVIPGAAVRRPLPPPVPPVPLDLVLAIPDFDGRAPRFEWPIGGRVISPFGHRRGGWHRGIDIKAELGQPVFAAAAGVVAASGIERGYGHVVRIEHEGDFVTVYAHQLQNFVEVGEAVDAGQVIGQVGRSGLATTYHLHFEIRYRGAVYDPLYLLPPPPRLTQVDDTGDHADDDE
jgi:murein DD-endopeptidase MepM/ murein hydrolase activator NlpD